MPTFYLCAVDFFKLLDLHDSHKGPYFNYLLKLGGIQVLRHQRGGWVGSEYGNF